MRNLNATMVLSDDGDSNITVFYRGEPYVADESHTNWDKIVAGVLADDPSVVDLFDIGMAIAERFTLSERVSYGGGRLLFDNDPVDDSLSQHIVRTYESGGDFQPLVKLFENIKLNPAENSRTQMFDFLRSNDFTITEDGMIVGYKGVYRTPDAEKQYRTYNAGPAIINGKTHSTGHVPQSDGDVVELPRTKVNDDANIACSVGLHVATHRYASTFGDTVIEVEVHPRDVVSVPNNHEGQKVRTCRYKVVGTVNAPYSTPIKGDEVPQVETQVAPELAYKHPGWKQFVTLKQKAKGQKKGVKTIMRRAGFQLIDASFDGTARKHWAAV